MIVSVIIPYYNEPTLLQVLHNLLALNNHDKYVLEIIVVNDGSTDETTKTLKENTEIFSKIKFKEHASNLGKGAAIKTGLEISIGDIIIIQDADLEYNPEDIYKVINPIINGKSLVCYGSRYLNTSQFKINAKRMFKESFFSLFSYLGGRLITGVTSVLFMIRLTDVLTCQKAIKKELLNEIKLELNSFDLEGELTAKILKKTKIIEVPVSYSPRTQAEGKKIKWKDGFKILFAIIKFKFTE